MEEIKLKDEEKLKIIEKVINSEGLYALNDYIQSLIPRQEEKETPIEAPKEEITNTTTIQEPSIYSKDAISLVEEDRRTHPEITEETPEVKGPVKKLVNNPWASAEGIKTVSPGELKL